VVAVTVDVAAVSGQQIEALADGDGKLCRGAISIGELAVVVVESGIHGVEDELQVRIHGTTMALEAREVMMGSKIVESNTNC
jgi:hypothetical protein